MQLGYVIHFVQNVPETLGFYQRAFGLTQLFLHEGNDYGELDTGATKLAFASLDLQRQMGKTPATADPKSPTFEIALITDDVATAYATAIAAGARNIQNPTKMPWGQTVAIVADKDGFLVELCTPIGS